MFLFVSPGVVSDVWFPLSETALASGICAGGFTVGNLIGFFAPTLVIIGPVKDCFFITRVKESVYPFRNMRSCIPLSCQSLYRHRTY